MYFGQFLCFKHKGIQNPALPFENQDLFVQCMLDFIYFRNTSTLIFVQNEEFFSEIKEPLSADMDLSKPSGPGKSSVRLDCETASKVSSRVISLLDSTNYFLETERLEDASKDLMRPDRKKANLFKSAEDL